MICSPSESCQAELGSRVHTRQSLRLISSDALVTEHDRGIPSQPRELRPLHRRLPERSTERLLLQRQEVARERNRNLPAMNTRDSNGESSGSACESLTFHGQTL